MLRKGFPWTIANQFEVNGINYREQQINIAFVYLDFVQFTEPFRNFLRLIFKEKQMWSQVYGNIEINIADISIVFVHWRAINGSVKVKPDPFYYYFFLALHLQSIHYSMWNSWVFVLLLFPFVEYVKNERTKKYLSSQAAKNGQHMID